MGSAASKTVPRTAAQRSAASAPPRRYPTRAVGANPAAQPGPPGPVPRQQQQQQQQPSSQQQPDAFADHDSPPAAAFADRLRQMGIVQPNPTFSPSSTAGFGRPGLGPGASADAALLRQMHQEMQQHPPQQLQHPPAANTTLQVLVARRRLQQDQAEEQDSDVVFAAGQQRPRAAGTTEFLPAATLRDLLVLRARGLDAAAIEARLRLKPGVVARLGPRGLVEAVTAES